MYARMRRERPAQLRDGYVSVREASTICNMESIGSIHVWIREKRIRARRVGLGKFAPWWVNVWDLLAKYSEAENVWVEGSDVQIVRDRLRAFIAGAIKRGELQKLQDDQPIAQALAEGVA